MRGALFLAASIAQASVILLVCCGPPDISGYQPLNTPVAPPLIEPGDAGPGSSTRLPLRVPALEPLSCRWTNESYESSRPLALHTTWETSSTPPFATVQKASKVIFTFSETNVDVFGLSFVDPSGSIALYGIVPGSQLEFFPKKPRIVESWFVPQPSAAFEKVLLEPSGKRAVIDLTCAGVEPAAQLMSEWPCDDIAVTPNQYDPESILPRERVREAALAKDHGIPLSTTARGNTVATLRADKASSASVSVTEVDVTHSRIVWRTGRCIILGWVPTRDLVRETKSKPPAKPTAKDAPKPVSQEKPIETRTCKSSVPLVAKGAVVGELSPDHPIDIAEFQTDGWTRLILPKANPTQDTHFLARSTDLEVCVKKPAPP